VIVSAVFDVVVFLQACWDLVVIRQIQTYIDRQLRDSIIDVLTRPAIRRKFRRLTDQVVADFLAVLDDRSISCETNRSAPVTCRDPGDQPVLDLCYSVDAGFLVTRDRDLLDLRIGADTRPPGVTFHIVDPVEFLALVRAAERVDSEQD
jgi:putative PIN family toxin of toxin-antitoxin system